MYSATVDLFVVFMYLDMVLTLIAYLSPRSKEANIFLGSLFRRNIYQFWMAGMAIKTVSVYFIMSVFSIMPNIGLLLMCLVGGGGVAVCLMNFMMVIPILKRAHTSGKPEKVRPVFRRYVLARDLIPISVIPKRVRRPVKHDWSADELGTL